MPQISCANLDTHGSVVATLFTHFLTSILTKQCEFGNVAYPPDRTNDVLDNHVKIDMIVVGSGSSGSVVANRLSEVAKWNVLLIEAGDDPSVSSYIPALTFALQKTSIDWAYKTEKQPGVCEGLENGVCNMPRGKALGGSSNMNFMMYLVGNPNDYNSWGSSDWNFKNVEKYFHKSFAEYYFAGHANDPIAYNKTELWDMILNAGKELNIHKLMYKNKNINPNKVGTLHLKTNIKDGERLNTAKAFLAPIKDRPNLFVMKNTLVTKILLDNKKATGVQVYKDEKYYEIKFTKELIISAGAVNTPQLLFQSGIGDEQLLKNENIDVKVNLPSVGKYLYDHPLFVVPVEMTPLETKKKRKSENKDETESSEEKKPERKHHRKQHGNEFIFGEEPNNNDKKNNAGGGRKSNKNHKHHKAAEGTLLGERKDPDNNEEGLTSAEERGVKTTDIPPFNIPTLNFKPVVFEEEPEVPQMPNINERLPTTITPELSTSPTTTTTTTTTSTSTARTMPDDDDDDDMDDVNYDEGYEADNEEQDRYRRRRSPRHKNKKNKNKENNKNAANGNANAPSPKTDKSKQKNQPQQNGKQQSGVQDKKPKQKQAKQDNKKQAVVQSRSLVGKIFGFFSGLFKMFFISTLIGVGAIFVLSLLDEDKFKVVMEHIRGASQNYISRDLQNSIVKHTLNYSKFVKLVGTSTMQRMSDFYTYLTTDEKLMGYKKQVEEYIHVTYIRLSQLVDSYVNSAPSSSPTST
uniref:Glucose dehydrogenase [FAD, quinone] n=1 Tax=Cacopsylla melanoneura TaxID=428564 RepID=A0A8D8WGD4_9HEMI